jgi:NADH-quinone oxidoreductase subunit N
LIGIPMTGGFFAKFYVFSAAVKANLIWLTIIGVVNSAIGSYYYLRIIVVMYMREARKTVPVGRISFGLGVALAVSVVATLYLGILPNRMLQYAQHSAHDVLPPPSAADVAKTAPMQPSEDLPQR